VIILLQNVSLEFAILITAHKIKIKKKTKTYFLNPIPEIEHNDFKSADHIVASFQITVQIRQKSEACRLTNNKL